MGLAHSPRIVTDGLVLCVDAANTKSYPGSGTTWTDISGKGHNGTLTNGPTFSSDNMGGIVFDGSNDAVTLSAKPRTYTFPSVGHMPQQDAIQIQVDSHRFPKPGNLFFR